jgi:hypothetical protein
MSDVVRSGAIWLAGQLKKSAGTAVVYTRGSLSATITATVGRSQFEAQTSSGVVESWESRDFILQTSDLPFGVPQRGDRFVETLNGTATTFECVTPQGVPLFRYADPFHLSVRIHCTRVG